MPRYIITFLVPISVEVHLKEVADRNVNVVAAAEQLLRPRIAELAPPSTQLTLQSLQEVPNAT